MTRDVIITYIEICLLRACFCKSAKAFDRFVYNACLLKRGKGKLSFNIEKQGLILISIYVEIISKLLISRLKIV